MITGFQEHDVGSCKAFRSGLGSHSLSILPNPVFPPIKGEGQPDSGHLAFKDGGTDPNPHLLYQRPTGGGMGSGAGQF